MLDFAPLLDFSRQHCIAICAFLVPANLLATLQTLIFTGQQRPPVQLRVITLVAIGYASLMLFHVVSWFLIGVVMAPTFILTSLGVVCFMINGWAIAHPQSQGALLRWLFLPLASLWQRWYSLRPQT